MRETVCIQPMVGEAVQGFAGRIMPGERQRDAIQRKAAAMDVIALDVGGTKTEIAWVRVAEEPVILADLEMSTPRDCGAGIVIEQLIANIRAVMNRIPGAYPSCLAVSSAGLVEYRTGSVRYAVNLPFIDFPLAKQLERILGMPVVVENDANAGALGEFRYGVGEGRRWKTMVYISVGTGVGGAIIENGKIKRGVAGTAGEFGHMSIDYAGPKCRCGNVGCVDLYSSGYGIVHFVRAMISKGRDSTLSPLDRQISVDDIVLAAGRGDEVAVAALERAGQGLGVLIANLVQALNPDAVVAGGGVLAASRIVWELGCQEAAQRVFASAWGKTFVGLGILGKRSGILGAAEIAVARQRLRLLDAGPNIRHKQARPASKATMGHLQLGV